jgi:uncharacterized repeat protein (TIGR03803 family)
MRRIVNALGKLTWGNRACAIFVLCAMKTIALPAQTFTTLHSFDGTDGAGPAGLVQGTSGDLYGTTGAGGAGANADGTIFKITPSGRLTTLYTFCSQGGCTNGYSPRAGLAQARNGDFYGSTDYGGTHGPGTIFKITPSGTLTTLYSFCAQSGCPDGGYPIGGLVQATNGNLYGTTSGGGAGGTIFKITPSSTLTTLYNFCSQSGCTDGDFPVAGLVQATNGDLYGTTEWGGANDTCPTLPVLPPSCGTVFKITPSGTLTTLHSFDGPDGANPEAGLVQAASGDLYGSTVGGGADGFGTVFRINPSGALTTLHSFDGTDGAYPYAGLVQATDGDFYGTTAAGGSGASSYGTVFKMTPSGTLTTLHRFSDSDGAGLYAGLVQATNGDFYGTTSGGGANGDGTVFSLSVGLGPFVETRPTSGKAGAAVEILGTDLTGATSVAFNGTAAAFKVLSPSLIAAAVPAGATTGTVQVITTGGTLSSNVPFQVP